MASSSNWTAGQITLLKWCWSENKLLFEIVEVLARVGARRTQSAIRGKVSNLDLPARGLPGDAKPAGQVKRKRNWRQYVPAPRAKTERTKRACLRCREQFNSDGPHNRICKQCSVANTHVRAADTYRMS